MASSEKAELLATPCLPCRENHLRCDRLTPKCSRCLNSGRECKLAFKFKSAKGAFTKHQRWLRTPKRLTYIDETTSVVLGNSTDDSFIPPQDLPQSPVSLRESTPEVRATSQHQNKPDLCVVGQLPLPGRHEDHSSPGNQLDDARSKSSSVTDAPASTPSHGTVSDNAHGTAQYPRFSAEDIPTPAGSLAGHSFGGGYPFMSEVEAHLFRHYVQKLAVCLDVCDPLRSFELVVPQRAAMCPTLLKAIFAISARHLSQTSQYDPLASNRYHDECLGYLIPMMNHSATVSDENLFAATVILRMLEEMDATYGGDNHSHLLGIQAFVNVGDQIMTPGSLSASSYWVGLRQEIYSSITIQTPVKINLDHYIVDRSFEPTDDSTWSNRAVVNLAEVLNFCFSDLPPSNARWRYLNEQCLRWDETRPASFEPFFSRERVAPKPFPEMWYHSSCHILGLQHHILAQLCLASFDPTIPRVGPKRNAAVKRMTQRIHELMRQLCGIGVSNQWIPPGLFTASMGISMFGDRFDERVDQEAMLEVLKMTERNHARPTKAIQQQLIRAWGWIPNYESNE
ncbi:hypothetical protein BX600DRAFT_153733 [Xylariales sp. PMI_506]|nr:hypothetical protein BX600DRAFT_153733 [Xylariales sp. PMI_506]